MDTENAEIIITNSFNSNISTKKRKHKKTGIDDDIAFLLTNSSICTNDNEFRDLKGETEINRIDLDTSSSSSSSASDDSDDVEIIEVTPTRNKIKELICIYSSSSEDEDDSNGDQGLLVEPVKIKEKTNKKTEIISTSENKESLKNNEIDKECQEVSSVITDMLSKVVLSIRNEKNEESEEDSADDSDDNEQVPVRIKDIIEDEEKIPDAAPKVRNEVLPEELPEEEDIITITEKDILQKIGVVASVVEKMIVIQADVTSPALDADTAFFLNSETYLGKVFDTFGPVKCPFYSIRVSSRIHTKEVQKGANVFFVPYNQELTKYVFVEDLKKLKGSDASWSDDVEPPIEHLDYSDDEEERRVRKQLNEKRKANRLLRDQESGGQAESEVTSDIPKRKRQFKSKFGKNPLLEHAIQSQEGYGRHSKQRQGRHQWSNQEDDRTLDSPTNQDMEGNHLEKNYPERNHPGTLQNQPEFTVHRNGDLFNTYISPLHSHLNEEDNFSSHPPQNQNYNNFQPRVNNTSFIPRNQHLQRPQNPWNRPPQQNNEHSHHSQPRQNNRMSFQNPQDNMNGSNNPALSQPPNIRHMRPPNSSLGSHQPPDNGRAGPQNYPLTQLQHVPQNPCFPQERSQSQTQQNWQQPPMKPIMKSETTQRNINLVPQQDTSCSHCSCHQQNIKANNPNESNEAFQSKQNSSNTYLNSFKEITSNQQAYSTEEQVSFSASRFQIAESRPIFKEKQPNFEPNVGVNIHPLRPTYNSNIQPNDMGYRQNQRPILPLRNDALFGQTPYPQNQLQQGGPNLIGQQENYRPDVRPNMPPQQGNYGPEFRPNIPQQQGNYRPDFIPNVPPQQGNYRPDLRPNLPPQEGNYRPNKLNMPPQPGNFRPVSTPNFSLQQDNCRPNVQPNLLPQQGDYRPDIRPTVSQQKGNFRPDIRSPRENYRPITPGSNNHAFNKGFQPDENFRNSFQNPQQKEDYIYDSFYVNNKKEAQGNNFNQTPNFGNFKNK